MNEIDALTAKKIGIIAYIFLVTLMLSTTLLFKDSFTNRYYPLKITFNYIADLKKGSM